MNEVKGRKGSDGKVLVSYPDNFDAISDTMKRSDLEYDVSERPWMKYLGRDPKDEAL